MADETWDDVKRFESYKAFERFREEPNIERLNHWLQAAQDDIQIYGTAFVGYQKADGTKVTLERILQKCKP